LEIWFIYVTLFLMCILFSGFSLLFYKRIWNPVLLCLAVMFLSVSIACLTNDYSVIKMRNGLFWITIGLFLFICFFLLAQGLISPKIHYKCFKRQYNREFLTSASTVCCFFAIICLGISVYEVMQVTDSFISIFVNSTYVRNLYLRRSTPVLISLLANVLSMNFYMLFCLLPEGIKNNCAWAKQKMLFVLACRISQSVITMSKDAFVVDCIIFISAYVMSIESSKEERRFLLKYGKWFCALVIILIVVVAFQRNYVSGGRYSSYVEAVIMTLHNYIGNTVSNFAELISYRSLNYGGTQCFRPVINVLSYFGLTEKLSIFQSVVGNSAGNVYTMFGNMYNDFSYPGIIGLSSFFGLFLGSCYYKKGNQLRTIVINAIIIMTMIFVYFDYKLMQTVYLFDMLYAVIFEWILRRRLYVQDK